MEIRSLVLGTGWRLYLGQQVLNTSLDPLLARTSVALIELLISNSSISRNEGIDFSKDWMVLLNRGN